MAWKNVSSVMVPVGSPVDNQLIFLSTYTSTYLECGVLQSVFPAPNVWHDIDLAPLGILATAAAIDIRGFLIITNGKSTITSDLCISFKAPNSPLTVASYDEQTIAVGLSGSRTNGSVVCPVDDGHINWAWLRGDGERGEFPDKPIPVYPQGATYGLNMTVQAVYLK